MKTTLGFTRVFIGAMLLFSIVALAQIPAELLIDKTVHYVGECYVTREGTIARDDMEAYKVMWCVAGQKRGDDYVTIIVKDHTREDIRVIYLYEKKQKIMWDASWRKI